MQERAMGVLRTMVERSDDSREYIRRYSQKFFGSLAERADFKALLPR